LFTICASEEIFENQLIFGKDVKNDKVGRFYTVCKQNIVILRHTFKHHLGGNSSRVADRGGHGRVLVGVTVDDEVDVNHFFALVGPLDADVMTHYQHVSLPGLCTAPKHKSLTTTTTAWATIVRKGINPNLIRCQSVCLLI